LVATVIGLVILFCTVNYSPWVTFLFPLLWSALIYGMVCCKYPQALNNFLNTRPILWIGKTSYSIYLVHSLIISVVEKVLKKPNLYNSFNTSIIGIILFFVITIALASITYLYIEIPGKSLYKVFRRKEKLPAV
jgi:peptidoglycan/LPS O-acetylase OafA/YrhL